MNKLCFRICWAAGGLWLAGLLAGCQTVQHDFTDRTDSSVSGELSLSGSSTVGPLAVEMAKRFESQHKNVRINVQTGGSSRGIADTTSGLSDIGMTSRELRNSESSGRLEWPIALDGVCFIVNSANPVDELSDGQLQQIITGQIDNWRQVGGPDLEIVFINRAAGRSELELVCEYFDIQPQDFRADLIAGENQEGIKLVSQSAGRMTYMSIGACEFAVQAGVPVKPLPLNGVSATSENVAAGKFPLSRPLLFITTINPNELARRFIQFAQSDQVHDLIREMSYVAIDD